MLTLIWAYFRLPETKGRTFGEIDMLFAEKVSARKFKNYKAELYTETVPIVEKVEH